MASKMSFDEFYKYLYTNNIIRSSLYRDVIKAIFSLYNQGDDCGQTGVSDDVKNFFLLFFLFIQDCSICAPLDENFKNLIIRKFSSHIFFDKDGQNNDIIQIIDETIKAGFAFIDAEKNKKESPILQVYLQDEGSKGNRTFQEKKPFVLYIRSSLSPFLFVAKYFSSKIVIENKVKQFFTSSNPCKEILRQDIIDLNTTIKSLRKNKDDKFELNSEQVNAILRATLPLYGRSLFITGGAGCGKTTVVFYLLYILLEKYQNVSADCIHLIAPSGKAGERLSESLGDEIKALSEEVRKNDIARKISSLKGQTIHSLLAYDYLTSNFKYNPQNPINNTGKHIFIIDEASMIDISLFAHLLSAIQDKDGDDRPLIYILGDPNQLPSVQEGAVLGELLANIKDKSSVCTLKISNRFKEGSKISTISKAIIDESNKFNIDDYKGLWCSKLDDFLKFKENEQARKAAKDNKKDYDYPLFCFDYGFQSKKNNRDENIKEILKSYFEAFYAPLYEDKNRFKLLFDLQDFKNTPKTLFYLNSLFALQDNARILCPVNKTEVGVDRINSSMLSFAVQQSKKDKEFVLFSSSTKEDMRFFPGSLVIITQNLRELELYNGDCGIIIALRNAKNSANFVHYAVFKKPKPQNIEQGAKDGDNQLSFKIGGVNRLDDYVFYPLSVIPSSAISLSYAITIHKSQGSGYENILIFLAQNLADTLLNRQLLYTAITRTKGNIYILTSKEIFQKARENKIIRWTEIEL